MPLLTLACLACGGADSPVAPPGPQPYLTIEVRYLSVINPLHQSLITAAADKWTRALRKDLGTFELRSPVNQCFRGKPALNETHHNPLIFVSVEHVDGPDQLLAYTQVCNMSVRDTLPIVSHIRFDRADVDSMAARGLLAGVIVHEFGHALGFIPESYLPRGLAGGGTNDPHFTGATARAEFAQHGAWYTGVAVPLEDRHGYGPNDPHWRFTVFGDEVMTGGVVSDFTAPLSDITLGLFKDLGYEVDFSVADPYEVRPLFGGDRRVPEFTLAGDVRTIEPPTVVSPIQRR